MQFGDQIPTGTYLDITANLPIVDPRKFRSGLLYAGNTTASTTVEDLVDFYRQLPNGDKQLVILPKTAHGAVAPTAICSGTR